MRVEDVKRGTSSKTRGEGEKKRAGRRAPVKWLSLPELGLLPQVQVQGVAAWKGGNGFLPVSLLFPASCFVLLPQGGGWPHPSCIHRFCPVLPWQPLTSEGRDD